nr:MAG TPA: hypothetical protein [Caudoviricetes sp.]
MIQRTICSEQMDIKGRRLYVCSFYMPFSAGIKER